MDDRTAFLGFFYWRLFLVQVAYTLEGKIYSLEKDIL
jgi:hypothetical protein